MLTLRDTFSWWIEAFPTRSETAPETEQHSFSDEKSSLALASLSLQSNSEPAFISQITQQVAQSLGITWKIHIPYRPSLSH